MAKWYSKGASHMKTRMLAVLGAGLLFSGAASAVEILCKNPLNNHMLVDDSYVSACLDAGVGNLTGNPANDLFINGAGTGYSSIGTAGFTQTGDTGTFSLNSMLWDTFSTIAIGFKFGTGNNPDEWFVYRLVTGVSSGAWEFVNVHFNPGGQPIGGGLSHIQLYGIEGTPPPPEVPEPTTLGLLGIGLAGLAYAGRRRRPS